ncbi:rho guanine nucleotide exchange factor 39 [Discoglossus pictus]
MEQTKRWRPDTELGDTCTVAEQRERWERKRERTARELVETERRYVEELELITKFYDDVFRARCGHLKMGKEGICGTIPEILRANRTLLASLDRGSICSGFQVFSESLHLYRKHADIMDSTLQLLETQSRRNKTFARFKKLQETRPEFEGRRLEELLELPLLRALRYKHYLRDLAENSLPGSSDSPRLSLALHSIGEVCLYIRGISKSRENKRQLQRVQKMMKGRRLQIIVPGRLYIKEGWLTLVPQSGEDVKLRMMFLFSDVLLVTSPCHPLHPLNSHKFACRAVYPLRECRVERVLGHTKSEGGLVCLNFEREKLLLMSDQPDIDEWYKCLVTAVKRYHPGYAINIKTEYPQSETGTPSDLRAQSRDRKRNLVDPLQEVQLSNDSLAHDVTSPKRIKVNDTRPTPTPPSDQNTEWRCMIL